MNKCKRCGNTIPNSIRINGERKILNKRRFCLDCSPFGKRNRRDLTQLGIASEGKKICYQCHQEKELSDFYYHASKKRLKGTCKECEKRDRKKRLVSFKQACVDYKGGKCLKCDYSKCIKALDFHHRDKDKKEFNISNARDNTKITNVIKKELDKCDLLCKNCHVEEHDLEV